MNSHVPDSEIAKSYYKRGMTSMRKSEWSSAIAEFTRAIELDPSFAEAYGNRGAAKGAQKDLDGALSDYDRAIELMPSWSSLKKIRSIVLKQRRNQKAATPEPRPKSQKTIPPTEKTLALRTDFADEPAWENLCAKIQDPRKELRADVDFVSDPDFVGLTAERLSSRLSDDSRTFAFIIDKVALSNPERPILAVDLQDKPGRTFRVTVSALWEVENNLAIGNMDFEEFVNALDSDGVFRGFKGHDGV